ncbi:MAG: hypothetical protein QXQ05_05185, partial [Candidatus Jordarchaeales archaeon]
IQKVAEEAESSLKGFSSNMGQLMGKFDAELGESGSRFKESVASLGSNLPEAADEEAESVKSELSSVAEDVSLQAGKALEGFVSSLREEVESSIKELSTLRDEAERRLIEDVKESLSKLTGFVSQFRGNAEKTLKEGVASLEEVKGKALKGLEGVTAAVSRDLASQTGKIKYDLLSTLDGYAAEIRDTVEVKVKGISSIAEKPSSTLKDRLADFQRSLHTAFEERHAALKSSLFQSLQNVKQHVEAVSEELARTAGEAEQATSKSFRESLEEWRKSVSSTESLFSELLRSSAGKSSSLIKSSGLQVAELVDRGLSLVSRSLETISAIAKLAEETEPQPFEDTGRIAGKPHIDLLIKSFLLNTKSTVTMVVPSIDDVPLDMLRQMARQRTIIVTDTKGAQPASLPPNVQLRHYPSNLYIINRDNEEMALAVAAPQPVGIYTTNMELIKALNVVLQDVTAKARKL